MTQTATLNQVGILLLPRADASDGPRVVNPTSLANWDKRISSLPGGSFFHSQAWARILAESYGHRPLYLCSHANGHLVGMMPLMEVASALTGRRGVALPFSDFSPVLASDKAVFGGLLEQALELGRARRWRYLELRGLPAEAEEINPSVSFTTHELDLTVGLDELYQRLEQPAKRAIRKAQRSGVEIESSRCPEAVHTFFQLHCLTRKRLGVPPQSQAFFEKLGEHVVGRGSGFVAIARWMSQPVAASLFVHTDGHVIYKYGASDETFQSVRPNNLMLWEVIRQCCEWGFETLHFGKTSRNNCGLRRFKRSMGAIERPLHYARYHFGRMAWVSSSDRSQTPVNLLLQWLPSRVLRGLGGLLYQHLS